LYVAMTRAESWLIVAAAGETGAGLDSWHGMITDGAARAALPRSPIEIEGVGQGTRLTFGAWPEWADAAEAQSAAATPRPAWLACVPEPVARPPRPVAATGLGGAKVLAAATDDSDPAAAMLRGTRLHLLLEHLPGTAAGDWPGLARAVLAGAEGGLPDEARLADLLAEARAVIEAPDLADIIDPGPDAQVLREVALSAPLPGIGILHGTIDRLIVTANRILAVDYKSNATVPATPEAAPDGILRQMAAYRAALRQIWPGRRIEVAILWTATRSLMEIPDPLLDRALAALDPADPRS
ncbi:MAG TPA: double-strand break repair helicase AddA, partial [Paracoccus sp.]|nr:double-strand break repair helicase AddA [Paracoccus sp. (in: a-proteobacteria)]